MAWGNDSFYCLYCGKKFENDPVKLALHIKNKHETERGKLS